MKVNVLLNSLNIGHVMFQLKEEQEIIIDGPGGSLEMRVAGMGESASENGEQKFVGIICHPHPLHQGNMDNKVVTTILRAWRNLGLATIRFNFRGVGKSTGTYGEGVGEIEDLKAVEAWVLKKQPSAAIWLGGFSFGTFVATAVAAEQGTQISALLTIAPPVQHVEFDKFFERMPLPSCPWIIIQGDQDEIVPSDRVIAWFEKNKKKKNDLALIVMEGASHFFHGRLIELQNHIETAMKAMKK